MPAPLEPQLSLNRARGLIAIPVAGGGEQQVVADPASKWPSDWSPDGRRVAYYDAREGFRLWTADGDGRSEPALYRQARFPLGMMRFFPGGGWVASAAGGASGSAGAAIVATQSPGAIGRSAGRGGAGGAGGAVVPNFATERFEGQPGAQGAQGSAGLVVITW